MDLVIGNGFFFPDKRKPCPVQESLLESHPTMDSFATMESHATMESLATLESLAPSPKKAKAIDHQKNNL